MKKALAILTAVIIVITSVFSVSMISASAAVLKTPVITKTETVANGIKLTWAKVSGAARYRVFVKNGNRWKTLGDTYGNAWTDKNAKVGKAYTYTLRCVTKNGRSFTSGFNRTGVTAKRLATPVITAFAGVENGTKITWNKIAGADKYRVFVKANGKWKAVANTTDTSYVNTDVANGKSYTYTVRCLSKNGKAFTSYFNTSGYTVRYDAAPGLDDLKSANGGLTLTWQKVNENARYRVFVHTNSGWKKFKDTTENKCTDTGVIDGQLYRYTVRCIAPNGKYYTSDYDKNGLSAVYSQSADAEADYIPDITKTVISGKTIRFSWKKIDGIFTYAVYYKDGNSFTLLSDEVQIDSYPYTFNKAGDYTFAVIACDPSDDKPHVAPEKAQFTVTIKYVVDQEAYSYQKPITEQVAYACCNKCGADVTGHVKDHPDKIDEWYEKYLVYVKDKYWQEVKSKDEFASEWEFTQAHYLFDGCSTAWHTAYRTVTTGYENVNVPEKGHFEAEKKQNFTPAIISKTITDKSIRFTWQKLSGIYAYAVYLKSGTSWKVLDDEIGSNTFTYSFGKAGDYTFAVIACDPSDDKPHVEPEKAQFTVTIKYVVDQEAYSYEKPITEQVAYACCNKCGADVTGDENGKVGEYDPEHYDMYMVFYHYQFEGCSTAWHTAYKTVTTGYETVNVPEKGHFEIA